MKLSFLLSTTARKCVLALAVSAAMPAVAFAQGVPGPAPTQSVVGNPTSTGISGEFDPGRDTPGSLDRYRKLISFGRCATNISSSGVARALDTRPISPQERRVMELRQRILGCGEAGRTRILSLIRGSLSEAYVLDQYESALPPVQRESEAFERFIAGEDEWNGLRDNSEQVMARATNCMVAQQPVTAVQILRSDHGSTEESALMDQLFLTASNCAGPDRPATLSKSFLRAYLSESLYRYGKFVASEG